MQYNKAWLFEKTTLVFGLNESTKNISNENLKLNGPHHNFVIFHLEMIFCQNFNLSHTYDHCPKKSHL
jgi:hypothetical protein